MMTKIKREAVAWAAILSMLLNALWPLLAGANPATPDLFAAEVCTANGLRVVIAGDRQLPGSDGPSHRLMPHCAFCSLGAGHAALHCAGLPAIQAARPLDEAPAGYRSPGLPWFLSASLRARSPPA